MCLSHVACFHEYTSEEMSNSVGVNGTVNGRGASSPAGNRAVNTSSFPVKGLRGKTKSSGSRSQKSYQDLGQLYQKTVQKTKEKVHIC